MSKYMTFESQSFANGELLLEALSEIGFTTVTQGRDLPLDGWDKRTARTADIIIRRRDVKNHHLLADIGFQKTSSGYVAVVDDMDLDFRLGKDFVVRLQNQYHEAAARKMAKSLCGTLVKERIGKTVKIRIKFLRETGMPEIEFTIDMETGKCETQINGIQGPRCEQTALKLRQVLGTPTTDQKTAEFRVRSIPKRRVGANE